MSISNRYSVSKGRFGELREKERNMDEESDEIVADDCSLF